MKVKIDFECPDLFLAKYYLHNFRSATWSSNIINNVYLKICNLQKSFPDFLF